MAAIKCPSCGELVSEWRDACPLCKASVSAKAEAPKAPPVRAAAPLTNTLSASIPPPARPAAIASPPRDPLEVERLQLELERAKLEVDRARMQREPGPASPVQVIVQREETKPRDSGRLQRLRQRAPRWAGTTPTIMRDPRLAAILTVFIGACAGWWYAAGALMLCVGLVADLVVWVVAVVGANWIAYSSARDFLVRGESDVLATILRLVVVLAVPRIVLAIFAMRLTESENERVKAATRA